MISKEIRAVIKKRIETNSEWEYRLDKCWEEEVEILTRNVEDTISFFENECTSEERSWISEVFNEILEIRPEKKLYECILNTCKKYPAECEKYYVMQQLDGWEKRFG